MRRAVLVAVCCIYSAVAALAAPPPASPRPEARSSGEGSGAMADPVPAGAVGLSPRPAVRPDNLPRRAAVRAAGFTPAPLPQTSAGRRRNICGVAGLTGESAPPIPARVSGCGLQGGVRVTAVQGVPLSTPAMMDCPTARALNDWVARSVVPVIGNRGGGLAQIRVAAHYSCRPRNNRPGARISEHGRGRAIDISGFSLRNGARIEVLTGWKDSRQGPLLRQMHAQACGPFGTVLGPQADRHHRDHFHLDTARYRSGPYCR